MLKRLELVGFKSFADPIVFEFPPGLTAVVGPNGSGKSNVVDAVKWVLGEQSAKSLRGGEMADVIFSGSSTRRSLGLAEVSLVFDNLAGALHTSAPEVQITRRVYRDGEGEYLINGQPSRLKDIRDLLLGTGAGSGAYCIIEQGRVDALLQASTLERREIFEEPAGISRFKVKKIEALRRLERVDANLQRLRDILAEVENQLRSVRLQAAKAQRFQEYTQRLRELRIVLGLREYRTLSGDLAGVNSLLDTVRRELHAAAAQSAEWTSESRRLESHLGELNAAIHAQESAIADAQVARANHASAVDRAGSQAADLEAETTRLREQLSEESLRIGESAAACAEADTEWQAVDEHCRQQRDAVTALASRLAEVESTIAALQQQVESDSTDHMERLRLAARMQNEAVSAQAHLEQLRRERDRLTYKSAQASEHLASLDMELETLNRADTELQERIAGARRSLADRSAEIDSNQHLLEDARRRLSDARAVYSGLVSRIEVLEAFERSHEGLGAGIRELLTELEDGGTATGTLTGCVVGLVGDFLSAPRDVAHLLDIALGSLAECFIVRDADQLLLALRERTAPFSGRIGFVPIQPKVVGGFPCTEPCPPDVVRADRFVSCDHPELGGLAGQLLGTTWLVPHLAAAQQLAQRLPGQRFITTAGELLDADGAITVGTHHGEAGILSRKSELRDLREQATTTASAVAAAERDVAARLEDGERLERSRRHLQQEIEVLGEQAADFRERIGQRRERRDGLHEEVTLSQTELSGLAADLERLAAAWSAARERCEAAERDAEMLQARIAHGESELRARDQERTRVIADQTAGRVALAQIEERRAALDERRKQLAADRRERETARERLLKQIQTFESRSAACSLAQLHAGAELALVTHALETMRGRLDGARGERDAVQASLRRLHDEMHVAHNVWQEQQARVHAQELKANDLTLRSAALVERLREEYEIDLVAEAERTPIEGPDRLSSAEEEEIEDLRRKLSRLGAVNLDSLAELVELERREGSLRIQFDDLTAAKASLHDIIATINADSRRLFTETFALVRANFQDLFRRLFGGGQADVILENDADVLESGVEVVARPPGKELRSISLMSGGEKTLTAVALLLAIFRSKPSPFCLLDEVDAALDEANTARLSSVLREFLDRSQFIIVTHSKRMMAAADVLYGVTMEESGVSKRVAVRFEDWPDETRQAA